ncbi:FGGY-family carbohydrate kinase [Lacibacterium aquatile]|uniref:FGGY-family carbohydrate kinase n=1 Tax=Lacibacterium aquatile TaxID=1168082 RepID=A0ABW5E0D7_9PROT
MTLPARFIAVLDIGKTNVKLVGHDLDAGTDFFVRQMPNRVLRDGPYPHFDIETIWQFLLTSLTDLQREQPFEAISITTHGAAAALINDTGLVLPILDYEHTGPDELAADYDRLRPPFSESFSPRLPMGLNLGAQLYWQQVCFPQEFAATTAILTYPQYWAWRLTGITSTEATSLGCHTDLWQPKSGLASTLVRKAGWADKLAPLHLAFDALGPVKPEIAAQIGLANSVPVHCGIHDSNASLLPHLLAQEAPFSVISTGTWAVLFAVGGKLDGMDPARDTLVNVDAFGRPVPSARFMAGREFDLITGGTVAEPDAAALASVLSAGKMALPAFAEGTGPFPNSSGRLTHEDLNAQERTAVASLYAALMTEVCLELLRADGASVIEGPFARNALYCEALAAAIGRPVKVSQSATGTSAGAALLVRREDRAGPLSLPPARYELDGFQRYRKAWRAQVL